MHDVSWVSPAVGEDLLAGLDFGKTNHANHTTALCGIGTISFKCALFHALRFLRCYYLDLNFFYHSMIFTCGLDSLLDANIKLSPQCPSPDSQEPLSYAASGRQIQSVTRTIGIRRRGRGAGAIDRAINTSVFIQVEGLVDVSRNPIFRRYRSTTFVPDRLRITYHAFNVATIKIISCPQVERRS